jgi:adenylate kinase family enzyme
MHEKKCIDCGTELSGYGLPLRCKPCAARKRYIKKFGAPPERIIANCEVCGKEFSDYASNRKTTKEKAYYNRYIENEGQEIEIISYYQIDERIITNPPDYREIIKKLLEILKDTGIARITITFLDKNLKDTGKNGFCK